MECIYHCFYLCVLRRIRRGRLPGVCESGALTTLVIPSRDCPRLVIIKLPPCYLHIRHILNSMTKTDKRNILTTGYTTGYNDNSLTMANVHSTMIKLMLVATMQLAKVTNHIPDRVTALGHMPGDCRKPFLICHRNAVIRAGIRPLMARQ